MIITSRTGMGVRLKLSDGDNPWAGHQTCPECNKSRWTMPRNGEWGDPNWVCVAPAHQPGTIFFTTDHWQPPLFPTEG